MKTILGTSKVDTCYRVTLVQSTAERLGVEPGDLIVFIEHKTSEIILRASKIGSAKKKRVQ